jgi:glycosyltransferase involved in cell wall biosynthesis
MPLRRTRVKRRRMSRQRLSDRGWNQAGGARPRFAAISVSGGVRHRAVLAEMGREAEIALVVPRLSLLQKALVAGLSFHPSRPVWRSRFAFDRRSASFLRAAIEQQLRVLRPDAALVLMPILFSVPQVVPYVVVADNTLTVTWRMFPQFEPLTSRGWASAISRERQVLLGASSIATESLQARESIIDDYGVDPERVRVAALPTTLPIPDCFPERDPDLPDTVLFVGTTFDGLKGGDVLRQAWPLIKAQVPSAQLLVAGGKPARLDELADASSLGTTTPTALERVYRQARVLVHPARFESSLPNAIREAMANGLPVVATKIPAILEHSPPLSDLFDSGDSESLATHVAALLLDRSRARETGLRLYTYAAANFQPCILASQLLAQLQHARTTAT